MSSSARATAKKPKKCRILFCWLLNRVLKWWRHKNEISEIMGFVTIFWKNNVQEAYLPKMSIWGQIVSEIVAQLCLQNSIQILLNIFWVDPKKN